MMLQLSYLNLEFLHFTYFVHTKFGVYVCLLRENKSSNTFDYLVIVLTNYPGNDYVVQNSDTRKGVLVIGKERGGEMLYSDYFSMIVITRIEIAFLFTLVIIVGCKLR